MSGAGDAQPPSAVPSVRTALLLVIAVVLSAVGLIVVATRTSGPVPSTAPQVTCRAPPPPPTAPPSLRSAPDPSAAGGRWRATLTTTCGVITLELDGRSAPATVASFVALTRAGYWTDSVCHRLTTRQAPTGLLQCGDPTGRGLGDPGYDLPLENRPAGDRYVRGTVGMARGDDVTGTAGEFFMVHRDFTVAGGRPVYTVFGRVVQGQEVVDHIAAGGGEDTRPDGPPFISISILAVTVDRV
ncbi:peptidylprolyl isomerase [Humibacillus xanthopallidus]|uniref:peptidylprolyl isomerase n=1 Tax=Humibacillus xanthopallidus TaxID=412689 RepID=UPI00384FB6D0